MPEKNNLVLTVLFRLIQLILLPPATVGYVLFVVKLLRYSRRTGTSATVLASFYTRYMQHRLGTRRDDACARLMAVLPNVSPFGLGLVTAPTLVAHRLTNYVPLIYRYPYEGEPPMQHQPAARTTFYDEALARHIGDCKQLVILGAGFDTRSYLLRPAKRIHCFEVDTPKTQEFKREMLAKAGVETTGVTYVAANFLEEDWLEELKQAGFAVDQPTFFLWESVMMYLDQQAVESTFGKIAGTAPGNIVAFDYLSNEFIESRSLFMRYSRAVINATGEPWRFGIDNTPPVRERVAAFLESCGLVLEEQRNFGHESDHSRALAGFAVAIVPNAV
jgi:methyltransferase (TIGR00027 family)